VDPVIEVATLVTSYLWALRDLFPKAEFVRDFDVVPEPAEAGDEEELRPSRKIADRIGRLQGGTWACDYALLARLQNIARRLPGEQWSPSTLQQASLANLDALVDEAFKKRLSRSMARLAKRGGPDTPVENTPQRYVVEHLRSGVNFLQYLREYYAGKVPGGTDYRAAAEKILLPFAHHAAALTTWFAAVRVRDIRPPLRGDGVEPALTREKLTDEIATALLSEDLLAKVAVALEYRPILLRKGGKPEDERTREKMLALLDGSDYPKPLIEYCDRHGLALPFPLVLHRELDEIDRSRHLRRGERVPPYEPALVSRRAYDRCLLGVALSGGGIRSATFSLGILQGLANKGWLPHIDYLSTVSGGGYIGAWLVAWIKRRGSVQAVQESLRGYKADESSTVRNPDPGSEHVRPIRMLREFSNYLAPNAGALSADTWTMVSIWVRNTALNLLTLTLFASAVLLAPQILGLVFIGRALEASVGSTWLCVWLAALFIALNLQSFDEMDTHQARSLWQGMFFIPTTGSERGDTTLLVVTTIGAPALAACFYATRALWSHDPSEPGMLVFWASFVAFAVGIVITVVAGRALRTASRAFRRLQQSPWKRFLSGLNRTGRSIAWGLLASAVGGMLVTLLHRTVVPLLHADSRRGVWIALAFGPSAMLIIGGVVIVLYLGFQGRAATEEHREWWSRLGAWLGLIALGWSVLASISYFAPYGMAVTGLYAGTLGLGWSAFTAVGAWLSASGKSNGVNLPFDKNPVSRLIIAFTPYLFVLGFLIAVAVVGHGGLYLLQSRTLPFSLARYVDTYWAYLDPESWRPVAVCMSLLVAAALLARRVDINEFSMHHFYKNRLVRAYLGASRARAHRRPNAFTGFAMDDDIKLWRFRHDDRALPNDASTDCRTGYQGPFPIINATLNLMSGDDLAWHERRGQSFVFTPLYSGYDFTTKQTVLSRKLSAQFAYRPTRMFGNGEGRQANDPDAGLGIGTAIAISGAAANPNAGHHTSPAVAFILTLFNARLGWWMGNPRLKSWKRESPRFGLAYLLSELFGFSGVHRQYVNLSDGGHFENMGVYELVRRRCRFIIVCDGEQDDRYSFNGMAGAIRKCRIDFGVVIDLSMEAIARTTEDGRNRARHAAVGTITYPGQPPGVIVYLKASITGDEPADVREYRERQPEFPHQPTSDQFFDESQFESYRALGQHVADDVFPEWGPAPDDPCRRLRSLMKRIRERC
jgi:hypothetical protein